MPRFKLTIEYAGTRYSGWQIQQNARTVQGEIDRAVRTVTGRKDFELYGSGRTDAGVHALGAGGASRRRTTLPPRDAAPAAERGTAGRHQHPAARQVPHRFHARHHAVARRYLYQIARRRTAFAKAYVWWVKEPLDVARDARGGARVRRHARFPRRSPRRRRATRTSRRRRRWCSSIDLEIVEDGGLLLVSDPGLALPVEDGAADGRRAGGDRTRRMPPDAIRGDASRRDSSAPARLTAPPSGLFLERSIRGVVRARRLSQRRSAIPAPAVRYAQRRARGARLRRNSRSRPRRGSPSGTSRRRASPHRTIRGLTSRT